MNRTEQPEQSTDENYTQNAWAMLKRQLIKMLTFATNTNKLFDTRGEKWNEILYFYFCDLIRSLNNRAILVYKLMDVPQYKILI